VEGGGNHRTSSGAYGFRLVLPLSDGPLPDLGEVPEGAPEVQVTWSDAMALADRREVGPDRVVLAYNRLGSMVVTREPARVWFGVTQPVTVAAIVHPISTLPLSIFSRWAGRMTLHGGGFVHDGGAWAVCGEQTAGKSSALALLGARGVPILSDDLVVIDGPDVLAGPRCVDLRPDVAERFPGTEPLGRVGARDRFRMTTAPAPARVPLRGIFVLEWGETVEVAPLPVPERLKLLHEQQYSTVFHEPDGRGIMALLDLPMWRFRRPRDWEQAEHSTDVLLDAAATD
jgi:hypothetical protein